MTDTADIQVPETKAPEIPTGLEPAALHAWKMAWVMGQMEWLKKSAENKDQHWKFTPVDVIADAIRQNVSRIGLAVFPSVIGREKESYTNSRGTRVTSYTVQMSFKIVCAQTGYCETMTWDGQADDYSDKGLGKAITYAKKTWLLATFLVSTGDDPDEKSPGLEDDKPPKGQKQQRQPNQPPAPPATTSQPPTPPATQPQLVLHPDDVAKLVSRARDAKYIEPNDGEKELLKLIGKPNWKGFTLKTAGEAIKAAAEKLSSSNVTHLTDGLEEKRVTVESARYNGKLISFPLPGGKWIPFFKGRNALANLTGDVFAAEWHILDWTGTEKAPETYEFAPLEITYTEKAGKFAFVSARPDYEAMAEAEIADMTEEEVAAAIAGDAFDPNDIDAFLNDVEHA